MSAAASVCLGTKLIHHFSSAECKMTHKYQICHMWFALYLRASAHFYSWGSSFELTLLYQQKHRKINEFTTFIGALQTLTEKQRTGGGLHYAPCQVFLDSAVLGFSRPACQTSFPCRVSWWQLPLTRGRWLWRPSSDRASNNMAGMNKKETGRREGGSRVSSQQEHSWSTDQGTFSQVSDMSCTQEEIFIITLASQYNTDSHCRSLCCSTCWQ